MEAKTNVRCRVAELDDIPGIWALTVRMFPSYRKCSCEEFRELSVHRFVRNPARTSDHVFGWLLENEGREVVGFLGLLPMRVKIGSSVHVAAAPMIWSVDPHYRSRSLALYAKLMSWGEQHVLFSTTVGDVPAALHASMNTGMRVIPIENFGRQLLLQLRDLEPLFRRKLLELGERGWIWSIAARSKLPAIMARVATALLRVRLAIHSRQLWSLRASEIRFAPRGLDTEVVDKFDADFDQLWKDQSGRYAVIVERTSEFLNWRHRNTPSVRWKTFVLACRERGELRGYIAVIHRPYSTAPRRFIVTDLFFDVERPDVLEALVMAAFEHVREEHATVFVLRGFHPSIYAALESQHPYTFRGRDLELAGQSKWILELFRLAPPGRAAAPSARYWYRVPSKELDEVCARGSWWPSGVDGDLNL